MHGIQLTNSFVAIMARGETDLEAAILSALPKRGSLVLAVSGGADSVALLRAVERVWLKVAGVKKSKTSTSRNLTVVHVNHKLRKSSDRDERFMVAMCKRLKLQCTVRRLRHPPKTDIERWARENRYRVLEECRQKCGADWILTAHNQNDLAETFLIKIFQNRDSSLLAPLDKRRRLIRPLVAVDRAQIVKYLGSLGQDWCADETNSDTTFARNWVRLDLLPLLEKRWGSGIYRTLTERAIAQQRDRLLTDELVRRSLSGLTNSKCRSAPVLRDRLDALPREASSLLGVAVIQRCFRMRIGVQHGASVARLIRGEATAVQLPLRKHLTIKKGLLTLNQGG